MHHVPAVLARYLARKEQEIVAKFWANVDRSDPQGCWIWTGGLDDFGYGRARFGVGMERAHRFSYELHHGPIPGDGTIVRHTCDVPACVNPSHLVLGTKLDNARDREGRGRGGVNGIKNPHVKLTEEQVREIRRRWTGAWGQGMAMCREFGIKGPALYAIVNRTGWKHLKD